jgi:hypothetical protein
LQSVTLDLLLLLLPPLLLLPAVYSSSSSPPPLLLQVQKKQHKQEIHQPRTRGYNVHSAQCERDGIARVLYVRQHQTCQAQCCWREISLTLAGKQAALVPFLVHSDHYCAGTCKNKALHITLRARLQAVHKPAVCSTHAWLFLFTRPGRPPPKGLVSAKSMCFWLSTRTMKEGMFTTCLPTLHNTTRQKAQQMVRHMKYAGNLQTNMKEGMFSTCLPTLQRQRTNENT